MTWNPEPGHLEEFLQLLAASRSSNNEDQRRVMEKMQVLVQDPTYPLYLSHILSRDLSIPEDLRQLSGLLLKTHLRTYLTVMEPQAIEVVKGNLLMALVSPSRIVRSTVGTCVAAVVGVVELEGWPELLNELVRLMQMHGTPVAGTNPSDAVDGAMNAMFKLCEDYPSQLDSEVLGSPLKLLIPKFIEFTSAQDASLRRYAFTCVMPFISTLPPAMVDNMQQYLQAAFARASDDCAQVRKLVCRSLVAIFEIAPSHLEPHIDNVVNYMMHTCNDPDSSIAIEACDFWNALCESEHAFALLSVDDRLSKLIPILLRGMVYSDDDLALMGADAEDSTPDYAQDMKPKFHKGNVKGGAGGGAADDDDEDDEDDEDDVEAEWNLRKCSASALDLLSNIFRDHMLPPLLVHLNELLGSKDWKHREAAILAMGAVADGCETGMREHLPQLFPFLTQCLVDVKPLVRSISCWTLSRYSNWVIDAAGAGNDTFFLGMVRGLLQQMTERNKRVQEAATSAIATLEEESPSALLSNVLPDMIKTFAACYKRYQARNMVILYDAIGTLADSVSVAIATPEFAQEIIMPIFQKWGTLRADDGELCPLLECLASLVQAMGEGFQPYAQETWTRCVAMIGAAIEQQQRSRTDYVEAPDADLFMYPLDLMSAICDAIKGSVESLAADERVAQILVVCGADPVDEIKQSAFALTGDVICHAFPHIRRHVATLLPMMQQEIPNPVSAVANNATWALGELALKLGAEIAPYVDGCLAVLVPVINNPKAGRNLRENVAITLGRLSIACPDGVGPHIGSFFSGWCSALGTIRDDTEKDSGYRGANIAITKNPQGAVEGFNFYLDAVRVYERPAADLEEQFRQVLHHFKAGMGEQWGGYFANLPADWQQSLVKRFGV